MSGCPYCGAAFEPSDEDNYDGWACGTYRDDAGSVIDRLRGLAATLPNDNGDRPDTDYQRGYMDACEEAARQVTAILRPQS